VLLKTRIFGAVLVAGLATSSFATAEDRSCPVPPADPLVKLLAPPPCDACAETKAEIEELQGLQHDRTDAQAKHAKDDYEISVARYLIGADIKFDAAALDKCKPIFDRLSQMTKAAANNAKNTFCRHRPFELPNNGLTPLDAGKLSPSYPSGHTTYGTAVGAVFAQMVPEKRDVFYARSADFGHSRMVAGVHYRSDVEAGKILGMEVAMEAFTSDKAFRTLLPEGTKCVRAALGFATEQQAATDTPAPATPTAKP
jgi:acid phosphatase (class A)